MRFDGCKGRSALARCVALGCGRVAAAAESNGKKGPMLYVLSLSTLFTVQSSWTESLTRKDRERNNWRIFTPLTLPSPRRGEGAADRSAFRGPKVHEERWPKGIGAWKYLRHSPRSSRSDRRWEKERVAEKTIGVDQADARAGNYLRHGPTSSGRDGRPVGMTRLRKIRRPLSKMDARLQNPCCCLTHSGGRRNAQDRQHRRRR